MHSGVRHFDEDDDNNLLDTMAPAIDPRHLIQLNLYAKTQI